ncbi:MAG: TonB-dependent receptor [Gammaproteobacteria bacterium]|nr:TonB-dependent receptor [Gammaproteobacteria bacterium]
MTLGKLKNRSFTILVSVITAIGACSISADDEARAATTATEIEELVVVGSLIKRSAVYEGRGPIETLDSELFSSIGAAQTVDILSSLTANTGSYLATQQNYLQGTSQFSLRGVGLSSTLTLINGRRAGFAPVSNDVGQSFFDINSLPVLMIDQIEILRDGASATYGSQAVAGVANIVTRKDFTGFELIGGVRTATNTQYDLGIAAGFESGRGHLSIFGSWLQQDENFRREFDWMLPRAIDPDGDGDIVEGSFDSGRGSPGSFRRANANPNGTFTPFAINGVDTPRFPDPDCHAGGGYPSGSLCRMDFSDQRTMIAAEERAQLYVQAAYNFAPEVNVYSELGFSHNVITDRVGNMLLFNGNVERTNEFFVPANHPFNFWTDPDDDGILTYVAPEDWLPETHDAVSLGYFGRPLGAEAAGENSGNEIRKFDTVRLMLGIQNDLGRGWTSDGYVSYAQTHLKVNADRHWISAGFANAIASGVWNPFGTRLVNPDLVTPKTITHDDLDPNLVGSRAANEWSTQKLFESVRMESAKSEQRVAEFVASGELIEWSNSNLSLATGVQYRDIDYHFEPDPLNVSGEGPQDIREFPRSADQRVWAVFAETLTYFGSRAELQVAARHERYQVSGGTTDPKISVQFHIHDSISLRSSWGTSFQAPSVFQKAGNTSSRTLTDPFQFDGQGIGHCMLDSSGAIVNRGDNFAVATVLRGGGLKPQTAKLGNFGLLFRPLKTASISVDLWSLNYRSVIAQGRSFQSIVDEDCIDDGHPNDPLIFRDSSGQLSIVTTRYENVGAVHNRGVDVNSQLDVDSRYGAFQLSLDATLLTQFDVYYPNEGFVNKVGNRNDTNGFAPTPELRLNLEIAWTLSRHSAGVSLRYVDSYTNDEVASQRRITAWTTIDAQYRHAFSDTFRGKGTVYVGARNLTDRDPPPLPSGRTGVHRYNLRPGYDGFVHDIKGRIVYIRFRWLWTGNN